MTKTFCWQQIKATELHGWVSWTQNKERRKICGEERKCDDGIYITKCTLELQGLSSGELTELTWGQSELVALKLQSNRGLWLGDSILTACYVSQLGNLHHISTFNRKKKTLTQIALKSLFMVPKQYTELVKGWRKKKTRHAEPGWINQWNEHSSSLQQKGKKMPKDSPQVRQGAWNSKVTN